MASFPPDSAVVTAAYPSPNYGPRKDARAPDAIILHYTGMESEDAALKRLCDPASGVSCHYLIRENGAVLQLVPESRRAWHAGVSSWAGETDMNSFSIGIEIANGGHDFGLPAYPDIQIAALIALCRDIVSRRKIPAHRILAHSDIAPLRKRDPGEHFPWEALAKAGIGPSVVPQPCGDDAPLKVGARGEEVAALQRLLADYGYDIGADGIYGKKTDAVVAAFQRHFRPKKVDGMADLSTRATLRRLIETRS
jgi:N-acetylmuramoyl-L-alanine amidase